MTLDITSVATAISALTVTGLTISDFDEIPMSLSIRNTPLLIPDPEKPITGFNTIEASFGASSMKRDVHYTLNYILIGFPVGLGRSTVIESFKTTLALVIAFIQALYNASNLGAAVEWEPQNPIRRANFTQGGVSFHAWDIAIEITELL